MSTPSIVFDHSMDKLILIEMFGQIKNPFPIRYQVGTAIGYILQPVQSWEELQNLSCMIFHHPALPQCQMEERPFSDRSLDVIVLLTPHYDVQYFDREDLHNSIHFGKSEHMVRASVVDAKESVENQNAVPSEDSSNEDKENGPSEHRADDEHMEVTEDDNADHQQNNVAVNHIAENGQENAVAPGGNPNVFGNAPAGYADVIFQPCGWQEGYPSHSVSIGIRVIMTCVPKIRDVPVPYRYCGDFINGYYQNFQLFVGQRYDSKIISYGYHSDIPLGPDNDNEPATDDSDANENDDESEDEFSGYETESVSEDDE